MNKTTFKKNFTMFPRAIPLLENREPLKVIPPYRAETEKKIAAMAVLVCFDV